MFLNVHCSTVLKQLPSIPTDEPKQYYWQLLKDFCQKVVQLHHQEFLGTDSQSPTENLYHSNQTNYTEGLEASAIQAALEMLWMLVLTAPQEPWGVCDDQCCQHAQGRTYRNADSSAYCILTDVERSILCGKGERILNFAGQKSKLSMSMSASLFSSD